MTLRITIGCDPGQTGALAVLADGSPETFIDMPTVARPTVGLEISGSILSARLRGLMQQYIGAHILAVVENVHSMPNMGAPSVFKFGESCGKLKGVLESLGIGYVLVDPKTWKRYFRISRTKEERAQMGDSAFKDLSRGLAIQRFPAMSEHLARKKDHGRADALLMARWAWETEQASQQAAA